MVEAEPKDGEQSFHGAAHLKTTDEEQLAQYCTYLEQVAAAQGDIMLVHGQPGPCLLVSRGTYYSRLINILATKGS